MGRGARSAQRREAEWLAKQAAQRCPVCGKRFVKRSPGEVCSIDCKQKQLNQSMQPNQPKLRD
jgi:hypothetical protein